MECWRYVLYSNGSYQIHVSTSKVAVFQPPPLHVIHNPANNNLDVGEHARQASKALCARSASDENNPVFLDTVVEQHLHCHQSSAATAHLRVEKQYSTVLTDTWRQLVVVEFRLSSTEVGLNQHATSATVWDHSLQAGLQDATTTEDHNSRDVSLEGEAIVSVAVQRSLYNIRLVQERLGSLLDEYHRQAIEVEDEVFTVETGLHERGVDTPDLVRVQYDHIGRQGFIFRYFAKSSKLSLVKTRLLVQSLVDAVGNHADSNGVLDAARNYEVCVYPLAVCFVWRFCKC